MILDLYLLQLLCHMHPSLTSWGFAKLGQSNCSIYHSHWLCMKVPVSLQSSWLVSVTCTPLWSWFTLWHLQWLFHLKILPIFTFFEKCFISYTNYQQWRSSWPFHTHIKHILIIFLPWLFLPHSYPTDPFPALLCFKVSSYLEWMISKYFLPLFGWSLTFFWSFKFFDSVFLDSTISLMNSVHRFLFYGLCFRHCL